MPLTPLYVEFVSFLLRFKIIFANPSLIRVHDTISYVVGLFLYAQPPQSITIMYNLFSYRLWYRPKNLLESRICKSTGKAAW